jgi:hypothetical protein
VTGEQQLLLGLVAQVVTLLVAAVAAWSSRRNTSKLDNLHGVVNGRLDELLEITRKEARAAGVLEGKSDQETEVDRQKGG